MSDRAGRGSRTVASSSHGRYGDVPTVLRLRNDLERLELDVQDVCSLPPTGPGGNPIEMHQLTDEPADTSLRADGADAEGPGGYRAGAR
jgi:hypothetical protein